MNVMDFFGTAMNSCISPKEIENDEDPRINQLRKISYGFIMPIICFLGIIGNILNLIVLTRRNMQGTAYIYMRGYSLASLLAITFCIPFTLRVLIHKEIGGWTNWFQAFYHVHLELYLGNGFLGVCVLMLCALTVERYASVCRLRRYGRPVCGPPGLTVFLLPLVSLLLYLPTTLRATIVSCPADGPTVYQRRDKPELLHSTVYQVYKVMLEVVFKIGPILVLAVLNLRIMLVYRRSCARRRLRKRSASDGRGFAEERRLILLLASSSLLFLVCVSPMAILNVTLSEHNLSKFSYQVFRSLANLLEVSNYSVTFYMYCLFTEDFRNTLLRTLSWTSEGRALRRPSNPRAKLKVSPAATATTSTSSPCPRPTPLLAHSTPQP